MMMKKKRKMMVIMMTYDYDSYSDPSICPKPRDPLTLSSRFGMDSKDANPFSPEAVSSEESAQS